MLLWHDGTQILIAYPQSIAIQPQFWLLNPPFSILLPQIFFIKLQFSIVNSSSSILTQKYKIFDSKCPQNSVISDKTKLQVRPKCGKIIYKALRCRQKSKHQRLASESCILAWTPYYLCSKYFACFQLTLAYFIVKTSTQPQLNST